MSSATVDKNGKWLASADLSYCELYDIVADPLEKVGLAVQDSEIVARLSNSLTDWREMLPDNPVETYFHLSANRY
ncbi:hypothetical protein [Rhodopirellula baltica]|uniref:Uncharacterized protein n=1 Tax=Rhodopirellula baltica SWK14 TaxID=993516 RepID=L7CFD3_RHOBT|nr:hypothetical protein [Rhodopirellula baltica]ELP32738.1 hypothetical protein RBSWK_03309 [Rhodopirellula baltica SWK14]